MKYFVNNISENHIEPTNNKQGLSWHSRCCYLGKTTNKENAYIKWEKYKDKENKSKIEVGVLLIAWHGPVDTGQIVTLSSHSASICFNGIHN